MVAYLDILDECPAGHNNSGPFMAADEREFGLDGPVTVDGMQIRVADTTVLDIDQNFVGSRYRNWNLLKDQR